MRRPDHEGQFRHARRYGPCVRARRGSPARYTMTGESISPPLARTGAPEGARSFAVLVHDPDAQMVGGFTHLVLWGIPADVTSLAEGESGCESGLNGLGDPGWFPPRPAPGHGDNFYCFQLCVACWMRCSCTAARKVGRSQFGSRSSVALSQCTARTDSKSGGTRR